MKSSDGRWLITGASRGIGAAVARRVASEGARVALLARSASVETVAAELGDRAAAVRVDVTDVAALQEAVEAASAALGGFDVVVANAGAHRGGRISRLTRDDWDAVLASNLTSVFDLLRYCLPAMSPGGAVVTVGAVVGLRGFPGDTPYGASKAGLAGLTKVLAIEFASKGVRVNCLVAGFVETEMTRALSERARDELLSRIPMGRPARVDEIAHAVVSLARMTYMTGAVVPVDGGLMAALGSA